MTLKPIKAATLCFNFKLTMEYRSSAGAGAGVGSWGRAWGAWGRSVSTLRWLGLRSRGRGGRRCGTGGRLRRWCAGSLLTWGQALGRRGGGGLVGMRAPGLAVLLVLNLLEVLLAGPHLRVFQLLHVEGLAVSQQLLTLVLQLHTDTQKLRFCIVITLTTLF